MSLFMILLIVVLCLLYTYVAVAYTVWSENARWFDIVTMAALMAVWPVALPVGFVFGTIRLRLKWRKYRGGRYLRKTFDAAGIDAQLDRVAKYNAEHGRKVQ